MRALLDLLEFLMPYGTHSLIVVFLILLACGFGLPMPEDIILITSGILASHGVVQLHQAQLVCFAGVLIGTVQSNPDAGTRRQSHRSFSQVWHQGHFHGALYAGTENANFPDRRNVSR